jgi:hypothetical protein
LVGAVGGHACRNIKSDEALDAVRVGPGNIPNLVVERLEDVGEPIEFRLRLPAAARYRDWLDLPLLVWQLDAHRRLLLDAVAVHVYRLKDALREVVFDWGWELWHEEVEED